jgi:2-polyprenyl-6-methoxyphenol hydroxylase-like FAD-dependent oxidoreductase
VDGRKRRAVIIGGSMSGLFTAAFLLRLGWDAHVYERSAVELVGRGAGITTHPELLEALEKCGAGMRDLGIHGDRRIALDREGRIIAEMHLPQIHTSWDRMQRLLRDTVDDGRYHLGHNFERVEQDGSEVVAHFAGGRSERADLLAGGDGIRSSVRAQLAPEVRPAYAGYFVWRGGPKEADLRPETRESIFLCYLIFVGDRHHVFGYPMAGLNNDLRDGHRRYNVGWYRACDAQTLREMCVDGEGRQHEHSVPPPLVREELIERMRAEARQMLPPQVVDCYENSRPFFTPIYDCASPRYVFGRVALVGDAASSSRPHMGFGMAKAGADAQALFESLRDHDDIDRALAAYDRVRQPLGERIVMHGRKIGTQLGVNLKTEEDRTMSKRLQDHRAMMEWIAMPHFLERAY